ncbi:MAG: RidA family protein [Gudongella sp.]|nr:RidA family protein [Gudongella sp.]
MSDIEKKLKELNIELPGEPKAMGTYRPARWSGNTIYLSGNGPMKNGKLIYTGKLGKDLTIEEGYDAARLSIINIIGVLKYELGDLDRIEKFVKLLGFVASTDDFYEQPSVINGASDLLVEVFGEKGMHARSAIGTSVLPFNLPVEIEVMVEIKE